MRANGTEITPVNSEPLHAWTQEFYASPSPDGRFVVVQSLDLRGCASCSQSDFALRVYDVATGMSRPLGVPGTHARWSPAGDAIAFLHQGELVVIGVDGLGRRVIGARDAFYEYHLDWSPDARWIIVRAGNGSILHVIHVATSLTLPLAYSTGLVNPAWRP
jgi:hypothetical protein